MSEQEKAHWEIWFSGRVQGVGFRYTVSRIAREFEVCGTVRNEEDGRVRLVVEGSVEQIRGFLGEIQERMEGYIRNTEIIEDRPFEDLKGFRIIH